MCGKNSSRVGKDTVQLETLKQQSEYLKNNNLKTNYLEGSKADGHLRK